MIYAHSHDSLSLYSSSSHLFTLGIFPSNDKQKDISGSFVVYYVKKIFEQNNKNFIIAHTPLEI